VKTKIPKRTHPTFRPLIEAICKQYLITVPQFHSPKKYRDLVYARYHFWLFLHNDYEMNYSQIGRHCGLCHGTIMNGLQQLAALYPAELAKLSARDAAIRTELGIQKQEVTTQ
jgi:chromosomal replication initiation ATPase DnaA